MRIRKIKIQTDNGLIRTEKVKMRISETKII